MTERQGVEIDYCPQCRGVWLDRGELDKIIERGGREMAPPQQAARPVAPPVIVSPPPQAPYRRPDWDDDDDRYRHRRRKNWLEEIFD
jgi:uncharacterized protein